MQAYKELLELSQKEKKGLTFFLKGQTVAGIVTRILHEDAVEVRNQTYGCIVVRLASIDALAVN